MFSKPRESAKYKKITNSPSKGNIRSRLKTTLGGSLKEKNALHTNIPLSVTLIRPRSYEKNNKSKTVLEKSNKAEENKSVKPKTALERQKAIINENNESVLQKVVEASKGNISTPIKENHTNKRQIEENRPKFKGFFHLLPLYEKELKKIEDAWLNTIYCSLSVRANLVKFLIQSFPYVDRNQFNTEDMKLIQCFDQVKTSTKIEIYNLLNIVKSILTNREKTKEEYHSILKNDNTYNKKTETEDDSKQPKVESHSSQKKKEASDTSESDTEKSQKSGKTSNKKKDKSFMSFFSFRSRQNSSNPPKENENNSKGNAPSSTEETKTEVVKLASVQKDFEDLKTKYMLQNETYEQKIKDLESLLEEKIKILKQEKEMKNQLQTCLDQFQAQQKRLTRTIGCEQLESLIGRSSHNRDKRLEELWLTAIKLILNGFFIQLKNLEMERNTMLFQLQSNDIENFNALAASIVQKDNFVKSIKLQMKSLNKAYQKSKNKEN